MSATGQAPLVDAGSLNVIGLSLKVIGALLMVNIAIGGYFANNFLEHMDAPAHGQAAERLDQFQEQMTLLVQSNAELRSLISDNTTALAVLTAVLERIENDR